MQAVGNIYAGSPWASEGSFCSSAKYELCVKLIENGSGGTAWTAAVVSRMALWLH